MFKRYRQLENRNCSETRYRDLDTMQQIFQKYAEQGKVMHLIETSSCQEKIKLT